MPNERYKEMTKVSTHSRLKAAGLRLVFLLIA